MGHNVREGREHRSKAFELIRENVVGIKRHASFAVSRKSEGRPHAGSSPFSRRRGPVEHDPTPDYRDDPTPPDLEIPNGANALHTRSGGLARGPCGMIMNLFRAAKVLFKNLFNVSCQRLYHVAF